MVFTIPRCDFAVLQITNTIRNFNIWNTQKVFQNTVWNLCNPDDFQVKIADFGLSKENVTGHNEAKSICGTAEYLAPEIL